MSDLNLNANIVICGAGIAGISAAYHLAVRQGIRDVVLVDERAPLTLTSDKGTQAYRNWWPGPDDTMLRFMDRSIELLDELAEASGNGFAMNRRGYVFLTADRARAAALRQTAECFAALGGGPLRDRPDTRPEGVVWLDDRDTILARFPFVNPEVVALCHARRAGWLDAVRLGEWLLQQTRREPGFRLLQDRVVAVDVGRGGVQTVQCKNYKIDTDTLVIAAGPYLKRVGALLGVDLPVHCELHAKMRFKDHLGLIPRDVPLMVWDDGVHFRPYGDDELLILWTYDNQPQEPVWPPSFDLAYGETLIQGMAQMIPEFARYRGQAAQGECLIDGGYYCKTQENRPLIGPLPIQGAYIIAALSGFGVMGSQAAAELLAAHISGADLPDYAAAFLLQRYRDPAYRSQLEHLAVSGGQL